MPKKKPRVRLIHWKEEEAPQRRALLEAAGAEVFSDPPSRQQFMAHLRALNLDAVVIDLSRAPSNGRMVGAVIRQQKATRNLPLVFVDGLPEKVARVKEDLPDATYCAWKGIRGALRAAMAKRVRGEEPLLPARPGQAPSSRPLALKLGLKDGRTLALVDAPDHAERLLEPLPEGAEIVERPHAACDYVLWFVRSADVFFQRLEPMAARATRGLWIAWPKAGSRIAADINIGWIRDAVHSIGMNDAKICSIDSDWSAMCFARRKS